MEERLWHQHYDYNVQTSYRIPRLTVFDLLGISANSHPDKAALNYYGSEISFYELRQMSLRMANAFIEMGIKKGDRVGLHLPNIPQYVIGYYAAMSLGAVIVNFSPLYTPDELVPLIEQTGVTTLITFDMTVPVIKEVCSRTNIPRVIATSVFDFMDGAEISTPESLGLEPGWHHFSQILDSNSNTKKPKVDIKQDDAAMIQFTGGTTGIPKGALLTQLNMVTGSFLCSLWGGGTIEKTPADKRIVMVALPLFHVYANIVCMNWAMLNAATMILVPRFEIDPIMDLIASFERITFFPAVPTMISAIINHPKAAEIDLPKKVQLLNSGGGPIPVEIIEKVEDLGMYYGEGWGMSETTSLGIANPVLGLSKQGSIGIPFPMMDAKLVDIETGENEVPQGEPGELLVKGPLVMKEYWDNPEKTAAELVDGWLHTGDVAIMDEEGYFFIVDRKKDMIIAGGYNIYPRDIDEVLYQHPKVADAISVGIPHEYRGETVKAYIVLKPGETCTEQEIIDFCKTKLAVYKVPKLVDFRDELPKSAVGKILRKVLRQEEADKLKG
ncbi:MAG: long-chain fatty acid--CoA ligase [Deltaproteobacteria bacterium]|nr:long-chain fatty acid--CoA ligase [Deltaproteobacteria bacterium]MBT4090818.1 long-chain fatty acid--CoA ligase [Deltaproteobacteria bacterium]MBT4263226.1 long-chain fatty acid--CoA ligase [Deltaproteobacteria bacterium]MBT4642333.1 long-chain fatty acid--CoA ligase [Deltaproteobacteria bacterium]MBT6500542.1 long-chain fatty acid--CoA ligase [Deltaproteobacteria bacterium]